MILSLVESPLQFSAALELERYSTDTLKQYCYDSIGMRNFVSNLPLEFETHLTIAWGLPSVRELLSATQIYIGDVNSGSIQRLLLFASLHGKLPAVTILDDGLSTISSLKNILHKRPLVRHRVKNSSIRIVMGVAMVRLIRKLASTGSLSWATALQVQPQLLVQLQISGIKVIQHAFTCLSANDLSPVPCEGPYIIGSALVSDGLINKDKYLDWLRGLAQNHPHLSYFAHRRETDDLLASVSEIPNVEVLKTTLPVETRLTKAAPHSVVYSLPTTATHTLPLTMRSPEVLTTSIPSSWWIQDVPYTTRLHLNSLGQTRSAKPIIVSISDSESYLKWSATLLSSLQSDFETHVWLIENPLLPTPEQTSNALYNTGFDDTRVPIIPRKELKEALVTLEPEIVLAAATGPVVQHIYNVAGKLKKRPGLVSGLPGVGLPATPKGQQYRQQGDLFITHSQFEKERYERVLQQQGFPIEVVTARLPMLKSKSLPVARFSVGEVPQTLIFAPQAKVPVKRSEREAILLALSNFALIFPHSSVIVKVRSRPGEHETHHEKYSYVEILSQLEQEKRVRPGLLQVAVGPLSRFLTVGTALITVSSTAALESLDRGLATAIISDFGVNEDMLNEAFKQSGITTRLDELTDAQFSFPNDQWLTQNYFQPIDSNLHDSLQLLAARAKDDQLRRLPNLALQQNYRTIRATVRSHSPKLVVRTYQFVKQKFGRRF